MDKTEDVIIRLDFDRGDITFAACKFMVAESEDGPKLRATDSAFTFHEDIVNSMRAEGIEGKVLGGGMLNICPQKKEIRACSLSINYGMAPCDVVEKLLNDYCAKIGYKAIVRMGER
ncbi:MAG: hypothetical protein V1734_06370 [Nanoarchaeota archaeon]